MRPGEPTRNSRYIYGRHPVSEALRARPSDVRRIYVVDSGHTGRLADIERAAAHHGIPIVNVSKAAIEELVGAAPHQGIAAAVAPFAYVEILDLLDAARKEDQPPLLLVLDQIQDPHNLGALVRSAYALGAHGVVIPKDRAVEVTPTVVKASAGATSHLPIARVTNLRRAMDDLKKAGVWLVGAAANAERVLADVDLAQPTALVIGSEGQGARRLTLETCDLLVRVPMAGSLGSLNASVAGAICLYEAARQRQERATPGSRNRDR
ncbi:MAG: 23S rRNA (guanosine(2251)-2'-O)-methyltransferase RlmB [Deltaproteobacteria bacterium]|nr:23S rRNA (guanosine(2251)-2'-O)-methyltransferase RlmB [Deltaproteobacteria bacterium]